MLLIEEEDDFAEYPIPEQFKIKYENKKLDVKHVDHIWIKIINFLFFLSFW